MAFSLLPLIVGNPLTVPELPKRMTWTSSSLRLFRKCKRKFFWKYIFRLRPRNLNSNLVIGKAFHNTLGEWYRGKRTDMSRLAERKCKEMHDTAIANQDFYDADDFDKLETFIETFRGMCEGYAQLYGTDRDQWQIQPGTVERLFTVDCGDFDFAGRLDLVARRKTRPFLVEHKTASKIGESYIDRLPLDTQVRGYAFGASHDLGVTVNEVLYDVVRKCKLRKKSGESWDEHRARVRDAYAGGTDYFYREPLTFRKHDIDAFEFEMRQTHKEYKLITMNMAGGRMSILAEAMGVPADEFNLVKPQDPRAWCPNDSTCNEFFRTCEYHRLCVSGLDHGTVTNYEQREDLNEELVDEQ